jgi:hypothetical protein
MQRIQRNAFMGLVALGLAAAVPAAAQDTTTARTPQQRQDSLTMPGQGGGADTSGYSGMERNDPTGARDPGARTSDTSGVETGAVRTENQTDTGAAAPDAGQAGGAAGQSRDPNGFRWTEPSDFARAGQTPPVGATDAVQKHPTDSLTLPGQGGAADTAGYSGMERDTSHHKADKPKSEKSSSDSTESR